MPRPCKRRRVCTLPGCRRFGPEPPDPAERSPVVMTVDELESIRLIDRVGMTQEQCAEMMDVARTTAQAIYGSAREKLAACLVDGRTLVIEGGAYALCNGQNAVCGYGPHCGKRCSRAEQNKEEHHP